ncbi:(2Fe-2S)-binding protein [bacterium]|nr:MAG: (2Fe-2S)-binding protein [bacterium]
MRIEFTINGHPVNMEIDPSARLLDILRENLDLTGTKEGCGEGECGACSVLLDGALVNSCLVPAFQVDSRSVETIEGLRETEIGKALIDAFCESGAIQCGFCSPGFIVASTALLRSNPEPTESEIRAALSGNLCRCTGYTKIIEAVLLASKKIKEKR